jgi:5-formyltetrahydrofolate cyclo-ligase
MKNQIREKNKLKRRAMSKAEVAEKSNEAAKAFLQSEIYKNAQQIMVYLPLGNETDTGEIIASCFRDGKSLILPVTDSQSGVITPCVYDKDTKLTKGAFSVTEPSQIVVADMSKTDVVIVPGIAFDLSGNRIGFGKGCYDRLLDGISAVKIGFCYDWQICGEISADKHDIKMDFLITEKGLICIDK